MQCKYTKYSHGICSALHFYFNTPLLLQRTCMNRRMLHSLEKVRRNDDYSLGKVYLCSTKSLSNMLKRKIEDTLVQWKGSTGHKPLVIMGIRHPVARHS